MNLDQTIEQEHLEIIILRFSRKKAGVTLIDKLADAKVVTNGVIQSSNIRTTTKVRILARQIHSSKQQVICIDHDGEPTKDSSSCKQMLENLKTAGRCRESYKSRGQSCCNETLKGINQSSGTSFIGVGLG